jgi:hypothetical protein
VALGHCGGELLALKQHLGDTEKKLEQVSKKPLRAEETARRYEGSGELPDNAQVALEMGYFFSNSTEFIHRLKNAVLCWLPRRACYRNTWFEMYRNE